MRNQQPKHKRRVRDAPLQIPRLVARRVPYEIIIEYICPDLDDHCLSIYQIYIRKTIIIKFIESC